MLNVNPLDGGVGEPKVCAEGVSAGGLGAKSEALAGVVGRAAAPFPLRFDEEAECVRAVAESRQSSRTQTRPSA